MKLMSGGQYKYDLSDVVGILLEHQKRNDPISLACIHKAFTYLYGKWEAAPRVSVEFLYNIFINKNYEELFQKYRNEEKLQESIDMLPGTKLGYQNRRKYKGYSR
jgi:hypothetical protein